MLNKTHVLIKYILIDFNLRTIIYKFLYHKERNYRESTKKTIKLSELV